MSEECRNSFRYVIVCTVTLKLFIIRIYLITILAWWIIDTNPEGNHNKTTVEKQMEANRWVSCQQWQRQGTRHLSPSRKLETIAVSDVLLIRKREKMYNR